jgi:hypothetical protein
MPCRHQGVPLCPFTSQGAGALPLSFSCYPFWNPGRSTTLCSHRGRFLSHSFSLIGHPFIPPWCVHWQKKNVQTVLKLATFTCISFISLQGVPIFYNATRLDPDDFGELCLYMDRPVWVWNQNFPSRRCSKMPQWPCKDTASGSQAVDTMRCEASPWCLTTPGASKPLVPQSPGASQPLVPQSPWCLNPLVPQNPWCLTTPGASKPLVPQSPGASQPLVPQSPGASKPQSSGQMELISHGKHRRWKTLYYKLGSIQRTV